MKDFASYTHSHDRAKACVRFGVGIWLLALAAYTCYSGSWWGVLLVAPAALHFYLGYRLQRGVQA
ncbi:MAG TPA: hypothetical protein VIJ39_00825 [Solirubrobacteraceae bacterium]